MSTTTGQTQWHGLEAWYLEGEVIRMVTVPELGAKIVSLYDKRTKREWLVGPGSRPLKAVAYGAPFTEQDMSGWDEMFPTIVTCKYPAPGVLHGRLLPDHGEAWFLPWVIEQAPGDSLVLSLEGVALPYRLLRTQRFIAGDTLRMEYQLINLGQDSLAYIWAAHPQFLCEGGSRILLPSRIGEVCNTIPAEFGWGEPETRFDWPAAQRPDGTQVSIDQTGPAHLKQARKFFCLPGAYPGWVGLVRDPDRDWLRLDWDPGSVPYLGIWIDEGFISHAAVVALEPTTGFYDSLATAWGKGEVTSVGPGAAVQWALEVRLGTGDQQFPYD